MTKLQDGSGWNNSAIFNGCTFSWQVDKSSVHLFGTDVMPATCQTGGEDVPFLPIFFWFFTYQPQPDASVTMCTPHITLQNVSVTVDLVSSNLTSIIPTANLTANDPFTEGLVGNMTT